MATVPNPITWTVGQKLTAALLNSQVRDPALFMLNAPLCVLTNSAAQTINPGVETPLTFDTEAVDSDGMHSLSTNTDRLTAVTPGWYQVAGSAGFSTQSAGSRFCAFTVNGGLDIARVETAADASTGRGTSVVSSTILYLGVGDYMQFQVWQNLAGITLTVGMQRLSAQWAHS